MGCHHRWKYTRLQKKNYNFTFKAGAKIRLINVKTSKRQLALKNIKSEAMMCEARVVVWYIEGKFFIIEQIFILISFNAKKEWEREWVSEWDSVKEKLDKQIINCLADEQHVYFHHRGFSSFYSFTHTHTHTLFL